jgi:leucyl aminopeptidase
MSLTCTSTSLAPHRLRTDVLVFLVPEGKAAIRAVTERLRRLTDALPAQLRDNVFTGKPGQHLWIVPARSKARHILVAGLGPENRLSLEAVRRATAAALTAAATVKAVSVALLLPPPALYNEGDWEVERHHDEAVGQAMTEAALLGTYRFDRYRTTAEGRTTVARLVLAVAESGRLAPLRRGIERGRITAEGTLLARDLANAPGNEIYPATLAARARDAGRRFGFRVRVLDEKSIRALGMGGLLGVASGSARPPRFLILEHHRPGRGTVVLVGKGVTFDSGGISIKPSANMAEMKMDMSGAAAVIGTFAAAARLKLPVHLVGLIPATENLPGGTAMRPGDILRHLNGTTSEVDNTDAEGRLILADALAYADRFHPDVVIDLATLTGAVVVALGHLATGMLGNDEETMGRLTVSGKRTFERVWQLPLFEEYDRLIRSDVADVKNVGGRWAGAITGAMFLRRFIGTHRWVHLDIAGTAIMEEGTEYTPRGASGVGVRLLIDFLQTWRKPRTRLPRG